MAGKNRTLRLPMQTFGLFAKWPQQLQPVQTYIRSDGLELLIGSNRDAYALLGLHLPDHPRDIPSVRVIDSSLSDETRPLLLQKVSALATLWSTATLQELRATRNILRAWEAELSRSGRHETAVELLVQKEDAKWLLRPIQILEHVMEGRLSEAIQLCSNEVERSPLQAECAFEFAEASVCIARGHGQQVFRRMETLSSTLTETAHRGWTRIGLHLEAFQLANNHWMKALVPRDVNDLTGLAELCLKVGSDQDALLLARRAMEQSIDSTDLRMRLADVLLHCGQLDDAIALLQQVEDAKHRLRAIELALYGSRCAQARQLITACRSHIHPSDIQRLEGILSVLEGNYDEAVQILERVRDDVEASFWLVEAHIRSGCIDEAFALLSGAKAAMGEHPVQRLLLGAIAIPKTWRKSDHKHRALVAALHETHFDFESMSDSEEQELLLSTLSRLGGNRSASLTWLETDGRIRSARHVVSPRTRAIQTQHKIRSRSIDWVQGQFVAYHAAEPDIPFWRTYSAELDLWLGDYDEAHRHFRASWDDEEETRWMYVGLGATLTMMGRFDEALEVFADGVSKLGEMSPGEATWAYRGEIAFHRGDYESAISELEKALELRPTRVGTRLVLALAYLHVGREEEARRLIADAGPATDVLFTEVYRTLGLESGNNLSTDAFEEAARLALAFLVGNRSSYLLTFRSPKGGWHVHPIEGHSRESKLLAKRLLPLAWESIASTVVSLPLKRALTEMA